MIHKMGTPVASTNEIEMSQLILRITNHEGLDFGDNMSAYLQDDDLKAWENFTREVGNIVTEQGISKESIMVSVSI